MKRILLLSLFLFAGNLVNAQVSDDLINPDNYVILERKRPEQVAPEKIETPKPKSSIKIHSGLKINKEKDKPCDSCYYYYEHTFKAGKYRKNTYYDRKAMTKEEKAEKMEKVMKRGGLFKIKGLKNRGKKICK